MLDLTLCLDSAASSPLYQQIYEIQGTLENELREMEEARALHKAAQQ